MLPLGMRNRVLRKLLFGYDDKWIHSGEGYVRGVEGLLPATEGSKKLAWQALSQDEILELIKAESHLYGYIHVEMMDLVYEDIDPDEEDDLADAEDEEETAADPPAKATRTSKRSSPPSAPPGSGDA